VRSELVANFSTYATVLVKRGTLKTGDYIVAGTTYAKVRRMTTADGKSVKKATPGTPVEVSGWKSRPEAGKLVLQALKESDAQLAIKNREIAKELERNLADVHAVNTRRLEQRKELLNERAKKMVAAENKRSGMALPGIVREENAGPKILPVVIKADVGGSAEAVQQAVKDLGNSDVKVEILGASVGEFTETDVMTAIAANGTSVHQILTDAFAAILLGFNIRALNPTLRRKTNEKHIEVIHHSIIYRLIDDITSRLESMLPPMIETRVTGEAEVRQLFEISSGSKGEKKVAGCLVFSGIISLKEQCRVTRGGKIIFTGISVDISWLMGFRSVGYASTFQG
jgi:translation initiation factor IF-2